VKPPPAETTPPLYEALDLLATMVAVIDGDGHCEFVNTSLEDMLGLSRRAIVRSGNAFEWFDSPALLQEAVGAVLRNEVSTQRFEAQWQRAVLGDHVQVHVIVTSIELGRRALVEVIEVEKQVRQDREERAHDQGEVGKELVRNLAHEIRNPLGGIRGAAQLLAMEIDAPDLLEYTQVIIHEADRLQSLVDRLLAPHRRPHVVADVNIHEVCERVRSLVLAEHPVGLSVERDYDASIPEFRGDREQLIQAVLNVVHNATQALSERIVARDALVSLRTRVVRQMTIGKHRHRLALELRIQDNGPGVPDSIRDRIFYPLVSGREDGSGLGLTIAQTYVLQHQGAIECESQAGRTVFSIIIPLP
jgi:two-component system, NtrC family, nitrogen regulation sensor histidine kinase GlnL